MDADRTRGAAAPTAAQLRQARVDDSDRDAVAIIVRRQCIVSDSEIIISEETVSVVGVGSGSGGRASDGGGKDMVEGCGSERAIFHRFDAPAKSFVIVAK